MLRHLSRATLTRGHTFATGAAASATVTPRIAICGAGVSGLTLAGILSNGTRDVQLTVFERARRDRDQSVWKSTSASGARRFFTKSFLGDDAAVLAR